MAQFNSFQPGSYVLSSDQTVHTAEKLKLYDSKELIMKNAAGQTTHFSPAKVSSFRLGSRKYIGVSNFSFELGLGSNSVDQAFVQLLDSGSVLLMRYEAVLNNPATMNSGWSTSTYTIFLLRRANERLIKQITGNRLTGGGPKFREALLPYLAQRPDLIKLVEEKTVSLDNIIGIIHALNTGQPYVATSLYDYSN